ncbi:MAG: ribonuclease H family protein [Bacteroidales bacterium]|nr:ribonuclease H family protein [Bacteroidales bacterium]MBR5029357.1 ribonuclease H family protein [Bacteroidales bacterium]
MAKKKKKYYVVWEGAETGVFDSWDECQKMIKGFNGAKYKSFDSEAEARAAFQKNYWQVVGQQKTETAKPLPTNAGIILDSLAVDAACSGNPGVMEYQGVRTSDKTQLFHKQFPVGTNNIGEFLAIVHGLSYMKKHGFTQPLYSDSVNGMAWVRQKKCKTKLPRTPETEELFQYIERAENWLKTNTWSTQILKWDTDNWGEIPADFNRKH